MSSPVFQPLPRSRSSASRPHGSIDPAFPTASPPRWHNRDVSSPYREVARLRPVELLRPRTQVACSLRPGDLTPVPRPAPCVAVVGALSAESTANGPVSLVLASGGDSFSALWDPVSGAVALGVTTGVMSLSTTHRSRRFGTCEQRPEAMALTLTGPHLTLLTCDRGVWTARARYDVGARVDVRDPAWLASLTAGTGATSGVFRDVRAGTFGQLGMRDVRVVTTPEGEPVTHAGQVLLSATCAGPGFFDTAHAALFALNPTSAALTHLSDLWFERPDLPGVFSDHAVHVVKDGDSWLVATSTWSDFHDETNPRVRCTLARTDVDLLRGEHVLGTVELPLPTDGFTSVGVWDPHLRRDGGVWRVAYVSARKWFQFHPVLADGPSLQELTLRAAATDRRATEGTTFAVLDGALRVLASDGRDNPRRHRERYPVFDLHLAEVDTLDAPYPSNIPWPGVVEVDGRRLLVTFDGTPACGDLLGYGTHGDLVVMAAD